MIVIHVLTGAGIIILLGYIAEYLFRKFFIPDVLLLIIIGYLLGPGVSGLIDPAELGLASSIFTTFTLLFLLFVGALQIELKDFVSGIGSSSVLAAANFFLAVIVTFIVLVLFGFSLLLAALLSFAMGGISSAFVIPVITQLELHKKNKKLYTVLTLESAITDVFSIVFTLTVMQLMLMSAINPKTVASQIIAKFTIGAVLGIIAAVLSISLEGSLYKSDTNYLMTIAVLMLTYSLTEYLSGSGAIAVLFTGLTLNNSKYIRKVRDAFTGGGDDKGKEAGQSEKPLNVISRREKQFYEEISFFLKTFFFVYIGLLLNLSSWRVILIGGIISIGIMLARLLGTKVLHGFSGQNLRLVSSVYARGLAPAVLMQIAIEQGLIKDIVSADIVFFVITATILFSSVQIYLCERARNSEK